MSDAKAIVGKRKNEHGKGTWAFPGGHLEYGETPLQCAAREVKEEIGIDLRPEDLAEGPYVNNLFPSGKHYITLIVYASVEDGVEPTLCEPEKHEDWQWVDLEEVPQPRFPPLQNFLNEYLHTL